MCEAQRAIFGQKKRAIGPIMAEFGPAEGRRKFCIFEAFSCNVVHSGAIISQQIMMDFYGVIFIFQGCGAGVGVWEQEAHMASF